MKDRDQSTVGQIGKEGTMTKAAGVFLTSITEILLCDQRELTLEAQFLIHSSKKKIF
jgi:hypothetical protein